jgi:hypothetical protein
MERELARSPQDKGLRLTLLSAKRRAERAEELMLEMAESAQVDLCRYRMIRPNDNQFPALHIAQSILNYQHLFTAVYDFAKSQTARASATYAKGLRERTLLNLAYTYPGSMGVLLSIPADRNLFGEGDLDNVVRALQRITEVNSEQDVKEIAREMGLNVVRKASDWAKHNWDAEYSSDVQWRDSQDVRVGSFIARERFLRISSLINQTSDEEISDVTALGTLVGYHDLSERFSFATGNGDIYNGRLHDNFARQVYKIPAEYTARMQERTVTNYAADTVKKTYLLLALE